MYITDTKFIKCDNREHPGQMSFESLYSKNHYIGYQDQSITIKVSSMYICEYLLNLHLGKHSMHLVS